MRHTDGPGQFLNFILQISNEPDKPTFLPPFFKNKLVSWIIKWLFPFLGLKPSHTSDHRSKNTCLTPPSSNTRTSKGWRNISKLPSGFVPILQLHLLFWAPRRLHSAVESGRSLCLLRLRELSCLEAKSSFKGCWFCEAPVCHWLVVFVRYRLCFFGEEFRKRLPDY